MNITAFEYRAVCGAIIEGNDILAFDARQDILQMLNVGSLPALVGSDLAGAGVGRIKKEKRTWAIVQGYAAIPIDMLDCDAIYTLGECDQLAVEEVAC